MKWYVYWVVVRGRERVAGLSEFDQWDQAQAEMKEIEDTHDVCIVKLLRGTEVEERNKGYEI